MQFRLRTLLIASALGPPGLALTWWIARGSQRLLTFLLLAIFGALFLGLVTVALDAIQMRITKS